MEQQLSGPLKETTCSETVLLHKWLVSLLQGRRSSLPKLQFCFSPEAAASDGEGAVWCGCLHLKIITNFIPSQANTPHMHLCTRNVPWMGHFAPPASPGTSVENSSACKFNLCYYQKEQCGSILVLNILVEYFIWPKVF